MPDRKRSLIKSKGFGQRYEDHDENEGLLLQQSGRNLTGSASPRKVDNLGLGEGYIE